MSALLKTIRRIHSLTADDAYRPVTRCVDVQATAKEVARLSPQEAADPRVIAAQRAINRSGETLLNMTYRQVRCHGDAHSLKALYCAGQVYMVDWEESRLCDPMQELSSMAEQLGLQADALPFFLQRYGSDDTEDLLRLKQYFLQRVARRVVQTFVGMPWDADKDKTVLQQAAFCRFEKALGSHAGD